MVGGPLQDRACRPPPALGLVLPSPAAFVQTKAPACVVRHKGWPAGSRRTRQCSGAAERRRCVLPPAPLRPRQRQGPPQRGRGDLLRDAVRGPCRRFVVVDLEGSQPHPVTSDDDGVLARKAPRHRAPSPRAAKFQRIIAVQTRRTRVGQPPRLESTQALGGSVAMGPSPAAYCSAM